MGPGIRRWLIFDAEGGYGTRFILPPVVPTRGTLASLRPAEMGAAAAAAAAGAHGGSSTASASAAPAVVAVAVGLQASLWASNKAARRGKKKQQQQCCSDTNPTSSPTSSQPRPSPYPPCSSFSSSFPVPDPGPRLTRGSAFALWELLHETGHALHFALGAAPPPQPPPPLPPPPTNLPDSHPAQLQPPGPLASNHQHHSHWHSQPYHAFLPSCLPLELVELPSSLLERGAADPWVVGTVLARCRWVSGVPQGGADPWVVGTVLARRRCV